MNKTTKYKNTDLPMDLPMRAMKEVPQPKANAQKIVALAKESGRITGYQLADGRVLSKEEGILEARNGGIAGVGVSERRGNEYLKSLPDDNSSNNLSNLPTV
jgi:hypothetical protein